MDAPPVLTPEPQPLITEQAADSREETERLLEKHHSSEPHHEEALRLGPALSHRSPFYVGLLAGLGLLTAYGLVRVILDLSQIIIFIVVALFLALGLEPVITKLVTRGVKRGWAVVLVIAGLTLVFAGIGWVIVPTVVYQVTVLVDQIPGYVTALQHNHLINEIDHRWHIATQLEQHAKDSINERTVTSLFGGVLGAGKAILDGVIAAFTVLVLTLYFMVALPGTKAAVYRLVPHSRRTRVVYLGEEVSRRVGGYVLGQLTVSVINGLLAYVMLITLGIPFSAVLAVVVGLLALVPIVGTLVGGVLVVSVALSVSWGTALIALAYYIAYHVFEAYVLAPRIMRRVVEVPSVVTIVAILAGGTLLGIVGALIAIPVAAGLLLIYEQVAVPRQQAR